MENIQKTESLTETLQKIDCLTETNQAIRERLKGLAASLDRLSKSVDDLCGSRTRPAAAKVSEAAGPSRHDVENALHAMDHPQKADVLLRASLQLGREILPGARQ